MYDEARGLMSDYMDEDIVEHMEAEMLIIWLMETAGWTERRLRISTEAKQLYKIKAVR